MGWIFSVATLIAGLIVKNDSLLIASGLFAIAGSVAFAFTKVKIELIKPKD
jgi:hypothetical protein